MLRVRLRYEKGGPLRFISHRDLMRIFRRAFAAAELPLSYSQGFNPHPRLSFGPSLRTGWESLDEYMDIQLESPADEIAERCNRHLPDGLRVSETAGVAPSVPKLAADVTGAAYVVRLDAADVFERRTDLSQPLLDSAFGKSTNHGSLPSILDIRLSHSDGDTGAEITIEYLSTMHGGKSVFPEEILTPLLGDPTAYGTPVRVLRKALYVGRGGQFVSPMSRAALEKAI